MINRIRIVTRTVAAATVAISLISAGAASAAATPTVRESAPVTRTVGVDSNPQDVVVSQTLGRAFVVNDGSVSVVSLITRRELAEFGTGGYAGLGGISVVNVKTGKTIKFMSILKLFSSTAPNMGNVAITGSGRYALVENSTFPDSPSKGQLLAINTHSYKISWRVTTGTTPTGLAVDTTRHIAYVPNYGDDTLSYLTVPK